MSDSLHELDDPEQNPSGFLSIGPSLRRPVPPPPPPKGPQPRPEIHGEDSSGTFLRVAAVALLAVVALAVYLVGWAS